MIYVISEQNIEEINVDQFIEEQLMDDETEIIQENSICDYRLYKYKNYTYYGIVLADVWTENMFKKEIIDKIVANIDKQVANND